MAQRKQPLGYFCYRDGGRTLFVPGHYETDCGGTDTLPSIQYTYDLIRNYVKVCDIVWEGLITQSDVVRCAQLHADGFPLRVFALNTPLEQCLASVQNRRDQKALAKGKEIKPLNPKNTQAKFHQLKPQEHRFKSVGVDFRWYSRDEALAACIQELGLKA